MAVNFAIIGGDLRQEYMAMMLKGQGANVVTYGLSGCLGDEERREVDDVEEALREADVIVAPIPLTKDGVHIHSPSAKDPLTLEQLSRSLHAGQTIYAGCIGEAFTGECRRRKVDAVDFMEIEEVAVFNTIATAEGAILEAILQYPSNLHGSECLVLGFGRCARTLADKLKGMSARTSVCARTSKAMAQAMAYGYRTCSFDELKNVLHRYGLIFNTVPAVVLGEDELRMVRKDAVILDVASSPGGVDYEAARALKRNAKLCSGLPGRYSPKASAEELVKWLHSCVNW